MPRIISLILIALISLCALIPTVAAKARHYTELQFPPLGEIKIPNVDRFQLPNGMVVYLMEDHDLPLVQGIALFRSGSRWDPPEKIGLATLTGQVLRTGSTRRHSSSELNQLLEAKAATVETGMSNSTGYAQFSCLRETLPEIFGIFAEVIQQPIFKQQQLDLAKSQTQGMIDRRNDDPGSIAQREFRKLIYGKDSPYGRTIEYTTLNQITRQDLVNFHQRSIQPARTILGLTGDFDPQAMHQLIESQFGHWKVSSPSEGEIFEPPTQSQPAGIFLIDQPQLTQSTILMGHLGGQLDSPDFPALQVMNEVLNGLSGRLFSEIRSRQGLAYSVYANWSADYDHPGLFIAGGETRLETTSLFIKALQDEIEKIRQQPITPAELARAKDGVLNAFVFNFEDPSQTLERLLRYEYFGYPLDFIFQYRQAIESVTIEDVLRVAKTYLQPEQMATLVVGNATLVQPLLSELTPKVISIDIKIPAG